MTAVVLKSKHPIPGNAYGKVTVWLIGAGGAPDGAVDLDEHAVVPRNIGTWSVPGSGEVTVELDPTSELTPAGMVYRADFKKVGSGQVEQLLFAGFTGAGPVYATDHIVDPPTTLTVIYDGGNAGTIGTLEDGGGAVAA